MKPLPLLVALAAAISGGTLCAQTPPLINYQGRVAVDHVNFDGTGQFKFALVNGTGTAGFWSNTGAFPIPSEPPAAVSLTVTKGLYSVLLGDTSLGATMAAIPASVFSQPDLRLRVWFSDGVNGFQLLTPDQRLAPTAYLADGTVGSATLADGSITPSKIATGAVTANAIGGGAINVSHLGVPASPSLGQVLGYDGTDLAWTAPGGTGAGWILGGNGGTTPTNFLGTTDNQNLVLKTNSIERLRLTTGGDLLIQKPDTFPTFSTRNGLGVYGIGGAFDDVGKLFASTNVLGPVLYGQSGGGLGSKSSTNVETLALRWDGNGNVGIGADSPSHRLSVAGGPAWTSNGWIGTVALPNAAAIGWGANLAGQQFGMGHSAGGFYMFRTASTLGSAASPAIYDLVISDSGNVGIGVFAPGSKLDIAAQDSLRVTGFQPFITLRDSSAGNARARVQSVAGNLVFETESYISGNNGNNYAQLGSDGSFSVKSLTIRGGADLAEPFQMKEEELEKGSVVVIDDEHPGRLKRSSVAYDTRVAGIISGANGVNPGIALHQEGVIEGGQNVALSGRVYVHADATGAPIKPGDLLTTSDTPGHAMKVTEHGRSQGAVIGKAMSSLKEGKGMVLVLVTLQ